MIILENGKFISNSSDMKEFLGECGLSINRVELEEFARILSDCIDNNGYYNPNRYKSMESEISALSDEVYELEEEVDNLNDIIEEKDRIIKSMSE